MIVIKYIMLFLLFSFTCALGISFSKKYSYRLRELCDMQNALNILKNKIKFTYEPLNEIFEYISKNSIKNISNIFNIANERMKNMSAGKAWEEAVECVNNNLKEEDKRVIKMLSKLLGTTDIEGQISQIEITEGFLKSQIQDAEIDKQKNEKLYKRLGITIGAVIVIMLI